MTQKPNRGRQAGAKVDFSPLIREVSAALRAWEESAELYEQFAERLVLTILRHRVSAKYFRECAEEDRKR